jgi:hypothetical protein
LNVPSGIAAVQVCVALAVRFRGAGEEPAVEISRLILAPASPYQRHCAIILIVVWDALQRLPAAFVEQWGSLSGDEKAVAMLAALPVLFYFGKNSKSYLVNAISALIGFAIVVYLVIYLFNQP